MALTPWSVGQYITASKLNDPVNSFGAWTAWTPSITGSGGTSPSGSVYTGSGTYCRTGDLVVANFKIVTGASWSAGTATLWSFNLPVNAATAFTQLSTGTARLAWGANSTYATPQLSSATAFRLIYMSSVTATASVAATAPGTWSVSAEIINGQIIYPAA